MEIKASQGDPLSESSQQYIIMGQVKEIPECFKGEREEKDRPFSITQKKEEERRK